MKLDPATIEINTRAADAYHRLSAQRQRTLMAPEDDMWATSADHSAAVAFYQAETASPETFLTPTACGDQTKAQASRLRSVSRSALFPPSHRWVWPSPSLSRRDLGAGSILGGWTPPSVPATKHLVSGVSEADWGFQPPYQLV